MTWPYISACGRWGAPNSSQQSCLIFVARLVAGADGQKKAAIIQADPWPSCSDEAHHLNPSKTGISLILDQVKPAAWN